MERFVYERVARFGWNLYILRLTPPIWEGLRKLAGGANPELSTQLFGYNIEGRLTQREGKQQGASRACWGQERGHSGGQERGHSVYLYIKVYGMVVFCIVNLGGRAEP